MQRTILAAAILAASAAVAQAQAFRVESAAVPYRDDEAQLQVQAPPDRAPTPRRYAATGGSMGGGFIEFLFSGPPPARDLRPEAAPAPPPDPRMRRAYAPTAPAMREMDPQFLPQVVAYAGNEAPGTIVIDTNARFLYLVEGGGMARRYGIGVGRPGFTWAGAHKITAKREWPDWIPPEQMLQRRPDLPHFMAGGPDNPLGARALYLGSTLYRIHGSNEPWTIGHAVSSGCIRMRNQDVIDLYDRVHVGTRVVVS
jgi:lipoprotein-anchoring transpeptidase ErfK/SrfK